MKIQEQNECNEGKIDAGCEFELISKFFIWHSCVDAVVIVENGYQSINKICREQNASYGIGNGSNIGLCVFGENEIESNECGRSAQSDRLFLNDGYFANMCRLCCRAFNDCW